MPCGRLEAGFDAVNGGWGSAPKFPQPMAIEFLLRRAAAGDARALSIATRVLERMAAGGIHDQLGGGFARYATDAAWLVPHFEKMLYDNAQLARAYLHAWALTGDPAYLDVARATLDFVAREMTLPDGAFAASLDADTGGTEGATYTWTAAEVRAVLEGAGLGDAGSALLRGLRRHRRRQLGRAGHPAPGRRRRRRSAAGTAILRRRRSELLGRAQAALLAVRDRRPQPARDEKALAGWNGLTIAAFADAGALLGRDDDAVLGAAAAEYLRVAARAADRLLAVLRTPDGRFLRSWKDGRARHAGTLEDQAGMVEGLLALYEASGEERWFEAARQTAESILARFGDPAGGFHDTADDAEALVARPRTLEDHAMPSGGALAATVLLRLEALTGEGRYGDGGEAALRLLGSMAAAYPTSFAQWLTAADWLVGPVDEVAIVGEPSDPRTRRLAGVARGAQVVSGAGASRSGGHARSSRSAPTRLRARCRSSRPASRSAACPPRSCVGASPVASP